ncbi:MAG: DUF5667 domain-containing protein [Patescibacteria group bacterium]
MKNFHEIIQQAKNISLAENERARVRNELRIYMHAYRPPIRVALRDQLFAFFAIHRTVPLVLIASMLSGAGIAFGAEGTLPGDILYPVKINVNEEIRGLLKFSPKSRVEWETKLATKRLEESERLTVEKRIITPEVRLALQEKFNEHRKNAEIKIATIENGGDFEVAARINSNFEAELEAHDKILQKLTEDDADSDYALAPITVSAQNAIREVGKKRKNLEENIENKKDDKAKKSSEDMRVEVEKKLQEMNAFIDGIALGSGDLATDEIKKRLSGVIEIIAEGKTKQNEGKYGKAFSLFQKAMRTLERARVLINANKEFHIQVSIEENGDNNHNENKNEIRRDRTEKQEKKRGRDLNDTNDERGSENEQGVSASGEKIKSPLKDEMREKAHKKSEFME